MKAKSNDVIIQCRTCGQQFKMYHESELIPITRCGNCQGTTFFRVMKIRCRHCHEVFELEESDLTNVGPCTHCDNTDWEMVENSKLHECADCGKIISRDALMCPNCGANYRNFPTASVKHIVLPWGEVLQLTFQVLVSLFLVSLVVFVFCIMYHLFTR